MLKEHYLGSLKSFTARADFPASFGHPFPLPEGMFTTNLRPNATAEIYEISSASPVSALIATKSPITSFAVVHLNGTIDWMIAQRQALLAWTGHTLSINPTINRRLVCLSFAIEMRELTVEESGALGKLTGHRQGLACLGGQRAGLSGYLERWRGIRGTSEVRLLLFSWRSLLTRLSAMLLHTLSRSIRHCRTG